MKYKGRTDEQIHSWSGPGKRTCNHPSCSQSHGKDGWKRTWLKMFLRAAVPCPGGAWLVADWHPGILTFLTTPRRWSAGAGMLHADWCIHYTATPGPHSASYSSGAGDLSSWPVPVRRCHTWHEYNLHCIQTNIIYLLLFHLDNNSDQAENIYYLGCNNQYEHSCLPPVAGCMQLRPLLGGRGKKLEPGNKWWHDPNICHSHATIAQKMKWPMNMGTSDPWHIQRGLGEDTVMTSTSITPYSTIVSMLSSEYERTHNTRKGASSIFL